MAKYTGKGCDFLIAGATAYEGVGQIQSIGSIQETAAEVDVSTLDAGDYRDYIQGFKETGATALALIFDPALATHGIASGVIKKFKDGTTESCAIKIAADTPYYMVFDAFIRDMAWPEFNVDDPLILTPTFRLRTPVDLVSALPDVSTLANLGGRRTIGGVVVPSAATIAGIQANQAAGIQAAY